VPFRPYRCRFPAMRTRSVVTFIVTAAVVAAGCSSSSKSAERTPATSTTTATTRAPKAELKDAACHFTRRSRVRCATPSSSPPTAPTRRWARTRCRSWC